MSAVTADRPRGWGRLLAALPLLAGLLLVVVPAGPAAADPVCTPPAQATWTPGGGYSCTVPGGGGGGGSEGGGDGGGSSEPTCVLTGDYTFCAGATPCRQFEGHPPYIAPEGPQPSPEAVWTIRECAGQPIDVFWSTDEEPQPPSLAEQAQTAIGQIDLTMPAARTSPAGRTIVNLPTWFWVDGEPPVLTGSSAFGLVAIATAQELRVDPGDGSPAFTCPWVTSAEEAEASCTYAYPRASWDGAASHDGRPAHEAVVTTTFALRFEVGGTPVTIPGAPTTLPGPPSTAVVRVDEVQSLVRSTG